MNTTININEFGSVIVGLLLVGAIFKNAFPSFPNRFIPLLTWLMGVAAYLALTNGWANSQQWLAAIIAAASATGIHSGIKNTFQNEANDPPPPSGGAGKLPLLLIGALLIGCTPVVSGCKSTPATLDAKAYRTLKQTQILVDKAMIVYANLCVKGKISEAQQAEVDQLHAQYREAFRFAAGAARLDYSTLTPDNVHYLSNLLLELIAKL